MATEKRLTRILASALDGAAVRPATPGTHADMLVRSRDGDWIALEVKWAGEGWPEDVRRVTAQLPQPWPPNLILLARHLSPGAIEWLRERNANWADEAGQARILGPDGLIVIREPRSPRAEERPPRAFVWSPAAFSLAEMILARADEPLRATELARTSRWSVAWVAALLKAFDSQGWTAKRGPARGRGAHRELIDADAMLAAWSGAIADQPRETRMVHRATRDVMGLLRNELRQALDRHVAWAVSGWAGLELAAPFATTVPSVHVYVAEEDFAGALSAVISDAGLREVPEGGRVSFWAADRRILSIENRLGDIPVASPPRLYADLSSFGARGQDAADHVKRELFDPLHMKGSGAEEIAPPTESRNDR